MFQFHFKDVVFLEKAGPFIGLAAFLAALEVKVCFLEDLVKRKFIILMVLPLTSIFKNIL